jgi:cellulose biosynthesis protein BcsQ
MPIVSIIGPKGGIGKTTLSINTAAALTRSLPGKAKDNRVCLVDLDLRLPTISSLLDSHPTKTFYDLFETLANKTYQVDFLRTLYQIFSRFQWHLAGKLDAGDKSLDKAFSLYKSLHTDLFRFSDFQFGDRLFSLFLRRGEVTSPAQLDRLKTELDRLDLDALRDTMKRHEANSWPVVEDYIKFIEEYGFSILGGEIPILGKKNHRKRINEPEFLLLFLETLGGVFKRFDYVILDTPAGGVNHLSSLMNAIDQVMFVFDLSNTIAVNGSIDALHSFIDYYEDFLQDFLKDRLTGLDKAYVKRLVADRGHDAVTESLKNKKFGIVFNRCQDPHEISTSMDRLREYLDTLDKLETYRNRISILGMVPHHKVINITNNHGALFYNKDRALTKRMDQLAKNLVQDHAGCPTLADPNEKILDYLRTHGWLVLAKKLSRVASSLS